MYTTFEKAEIQAFDVLFLRSNDYQTQMMIRFLFLIAHGVYEYLPYKIYDNKSDVITPVGEKLTAEQWLDRYQWGRYTKMIVGGGIINGSVALVFDDEVERYRKAGCDFSACTTDEDYLAAIEAFEDNPPVADAGVSDQTRIADALEDMVALSLPDAE